MKILLVINDMSVGGAQRIVCSLANYYLKIGNKVNIQDGAVIHATYK